VRRELPAGTVTFLFTDVEGSTKLLHELGAEGYADQLAAHRTVVRQACTERDGVEVDTQGDAFFLAFPSAPDAVDAARAITEDLAAGPITLRIGLHTCTPFLTDEGYVGQDVHLAARVASSAHGGQVVLSQATRTLLGERYTLVELGEHRLKDIADPVAIFQLGTSQFAPLKTISNTNLPRPASSFIGRERELQEVLARIDEGRRLLTLTGPGGSGKTRLALEAAATRVPDYKAGVFWVGLASLRDPALVSETIAQTLGAKDGLVEHIGERQLLLLLDNLEQVIEAGPELSTLLQGCPNLTLLVTSRALLRVQGEIEYPVPPLAGSAAVSLFCERAQTAPSEEIALLCRRLDNLPLAVELAAARARVLSPPQILERLSQRLDLLRGGRDADTRQQTLRATIDWSYDLLAEHEQELFGHLAVFAGGCTLEAAEEVCDADLDTLQALVEKSLVRFSSERYWMLETIREHAGGRLEESAGADHLKREHAEWFATLVESAERELESAGQDAWLDRLELEHDNVRAALRFALDVGGANLGLRLAGSSATFWWIRGHWTEGRRWLEEAISASGRQDRGARAKALEGAAHLAARQLDYSLAEKLGRECLDLSRELNDASRIARSLRVLAIVATGAGDAERLRGLLEQSEAFARESEDSWALSMALNNLGYLALETENVVRASVLFEEALQLARDRGDRRSEAFFLENRALAKLELKFAEEARDDFAASLRLAHRLGFVEIVAEDLLGIAAVGVETGELEAAATLVGGAQLLREQIGARLDPVERRVEARAVEAIQRGLGSGSAAALLRGRALSLDALIDLALHDMDRRGNVGVTSTQRSVGRVSKPLDASGSS
jgi:predicted ATPase